MRAWQRLAVAVVAGFVIAGLLVVGHQSSLARRSADFTINYAAALLIREGHPQAIYQRDQLGPLMLLARWLPLGRRSLPLAMTALLAFPATWALFSEGQSSALLLLGAVLLVGAW